MIDKLERPLPKPTTEDYVSARVLEALIESRLAVEFLSKGLTRNAAGKAFQAWKSLMASLLKLELNRLLQVIKDEDEKRWLVEKAVPRVPTTRIMALSLMLKGLEYEDITLWTERALNLHDYQYHGPDPDMALSKYRNPNEAAAAVLELVAAVINYVDKLRGRIKWTDEVDKAYNELKDALSKHVP